MTARASLIPWVLASLCAATLASQPAEAAKPKRKTAEPASASYRVSIPEPTSGYVHVTLELEEASSSATTLSMPAWTPGSYLIRDFGKHVYDVVAHDAAGRALTVTRVDKQTWTVANGGRGFVAEYRVFAHELSVRTSYVDDRFALLNGAGLFMYVDELTTRASKLELLAPSGWESHTSYATGTYDELVDSPILLGESSVVEVREFTVAGKPIALVFSAAAGSNVDLDRLAADAERIIRAFARTLNGLPFSGYQLIVVADEVGGGGLEHRDSAAMIVDPWMFADASGYARMQRLIAHEFFHLWNVKRIHDEVLGPFDYTQETYSDLLWFHEGLTETMETRALLRAGLVSADDYLGQLASAWTSYHRKPGRNAAAIAELSREAWIKSYKPEANHSETTISYYEKGNLIGVCLDLELRLRSRAHHGGGSLDGLFRRLWAARDPVRGDVAIDLDDIVAAASAEAGEDMRWFFERYVLGTEELPLPELLERAGFVVESAKLGALDPRAAVWSGLGGGSSIGSIEPESPAAAAGLMLGDELIAVNGTRVESTSEAHERLADLGVGATATLSLFRRDRLETRELTTQASPHQAWAVSRPTEPGDLELARLRELWLLEHLLP